MGITPLVSSSEVTQLCFDKRLTQDFFRKAGVAAPAILDPRSVLADQKISYPLFLKPACGSSSVGATRIDNRRQLEFFLNCTPDPVLQEFWRAKSTPLISWPTSRGECAAWSPDSGSRPGPGRSVKA